MDPDLPGKDSSEIGEEPLLRVEAQDSHSFRWLQSELQRKRQCVREKSDTDQSECQRYCITLMKDLAVSQAAL